ncbi:Single-stranded-DNA-specific exonuclease RecJ [Arsenophonus endosymbiont of Bemisia tabaci Q2]|nr:Single-stranded-DNA-specific exonuclease RecJ [Arsenophonus endosymbiont of Bemisia tabaci Q2]
MVWHLRDALERLDMLNPGLILKFGGHAMAAGLTLEEQKFTQFQENFANLMAELLDNNMLEGVIWSDGELNNEELSLDIAELIRNGGPWGQAFPEPIFDGKFRLLQQRLAGDCHLKVMLEPLAGGPIIDGIAFNIDTAYWPDNSIKMVELAYKLNVNEYRGNRNIQLLIQHLWPCK